MSTLGWVVVVAIALVLLGIVAWVAFTRNRSHGLQDQFGPEYERAVGETGSRRDAEAELLERRSRYHDLDIRPLPQDAADAYAREWRRVQAGFVDEPERSFVEADRLVVAVMRDRGYPMGEFDQRAADVSVEHPGVVEHYRAAHAVALQADRGRAETEDLRQGMVHYRALFEDLLDDRRSEVN